MTRRFHAQVREARLSFSRSLHLRPWEEELWKEDLSWCQHLYQHILAEEEAKRQFAKESREHEGGFCLFSRSQLFYEKISTQ